MSQSGVLERRAVAMGSRGVSAAAVAIFAATQAIFFLRLQNYPTGYVDGAGSWDGNFYREIAMTGYGKDTDSGVSGTWAFYPVYPLLIRAVSFMTGLDITLSGVLVSLAAGTAAMVLLARLIDVHVGRSSALLVVAVVCTWPAAPSMQMVYTESLAYLLLVSAFAFLLSGRYWPMLITVLMLSLTRPIAAPFAVVVGVHLLNRWAALDRLGRLRMVAFASGCALASFSWPILAGALAGEGSIYFDAMAAFHPGSMPSSWAAWAIESGPLAVTLMCSMIGILVWFALRMIPRNCPIEIRVWVIGYCVFLLAASIPRGSIVRYLLFAFPFALAWVPLARTPRVGRLVFGAILLIGLVSGLAWIGLFVQGRAAP